ncbi:unnamed protein product [Adineta ricciae]|uniref:Uncharacterized protein n=1 Tax=Adineta ricciae TaxID=249248 RepID=A0A814HNA1_ADIRI|nr:unnamed protein product [Adineta ricciae]
MPRRSGGGMRSSSPSRAPPPPPTRAVAPPPPAAPAPVMAPQGRQPGLFGQMAATAGGVAVGSAVGHTIGAAITGGFRGNDQPAATQEASGPNAQQLYQAPNERYSTERCNLYQKEFMKCLDQSGGDSSQCQGFWEALKSYWYSDFLSDTRSSTQITLKPVGFLDSLAFENLLTNNACSIVSCPCADVALKTRMKTLSQMGIDQTYLNCKS